jgi:hypothetical protein
MWQRPGVINDGTQVAHINPPSTIGPSDVIVSRFLREKPKPYPDTCRAEWASSESIL